MFDTRAVSGNPWWWALYAAVVIAIVAGFVGQMLRGECPV